MIWGSGLVSLLTALGAPRPSASSHVTPWIFVRTLGLLVRNHPGLGSENDVYHPTKISILLGIVIYPADG